MAFRLYNPERKEKAMRIKNCFQIILVFTIAAVFLLGCASNMPSTQKTIKSKTVPKEEHEIKLTGYTVKHIVRNGRADGPQTTVVQGFSGKILISPDDIARSAEGRPESGTIAIVEPYGTGDSMLLLSLNNGALLGSKYEGQKLVLEVDMRDMSYLLGAGSTYLIKPGIQKVRLGNFYVSTSAAKEWCSVQISGPSIEPKLSGEGIKVLKVP
jgi:hypothetical protein